jgi:hypothetical protein
MTKIEWLEIVASLNIIEKDLSRFPSQGQGPMIEALRGNLISEIKLKIINIKSIMIREEFRYGK